MAANKSNVITDELKKNIRAVLLSKEKGIPLLNVIRDYQSLVGEQLRPRQFGFTDIRSMLEGLPDVARVVQRADGTATVFPVDNDHALLYVNETARRALRIPKNSGPVAGRAMAQRVDISSGPAGDQIFIGNLPYEPKEQQVMADLAMLFSSHGKFPIRLVTNNSARKRFGFMCVPPELEADVCETFHLTKFAGKSLVVVPTRAKAKADSAAKSEAGCQGDTVNTTAETQPGNPPIMGNSGDSTSLPKAHNLGNAKGPVAEIPPKDRIVSMVQGNPKLSNSPIPGESRDSGKLPLGNPGKSGPLSQVLESSADYAPAGMEGCYEDYYYYDVNTGDYVYCGDDDKYDYYYYDDEYDGEDDGTVQVYDTEEAGDEDGEVLSDGIMAFADGFSVVVMGFPYGTAEELIAKRFSDIAVPMNVLITNNHPARGPTRAIVQFESLQEALDCVSLKWVIGGHKVTCQLAEQLEINTSDTGSRHVKPYASYSATPRTVTPLLQPMYHPNPFTSNPRNFYSQFSGTGASNAATDGVESAIASMILQDQGPGVDAERGQRSGHDGRGRGASRGTAGRGSFRGSSEEISSRPGDRRQQGHLHKPPAQFSRDTEPCVNSSSKDQHDRGPTRCIYLYRLGERTVEADLYPILSKLGNVTSIRITRDLKTGVSMGYGFVYMASVADAVKVMNFLTENGLTLNGKHIGFKFNEEKSFQPDPAGDKPRVFDSANSRRPEEKSGPDSRSKSTDSLPRPGQDQAKNPAVEKLGKTDPGSMNVRSSLLGNLDFAKTQTTKSPIAVSVNGPVAEKPPGQAPSENVHKTDQTVPKDGPIGVKPGAATTGVSPTSAKNDPPSRSEVSMETNGLAARRTGPPDQSSPTAARGSGLPEVYRTGLPGAPGSGPPGSQGDRIRPRDPIGHQQAAGGPRPIPVPTVKASSSWKQPLSVVNGNAAAQVPSLPKTQPTSASSEAAKSGTELALPGGMRTGLLDAMMSDCFPDQKMSGLKDLARDVNLFVVYVEPDDVRFFWAVVVDGAADTRMMDLLDAVSRAGSSGGPLEGACRRAITQYHTEWNRVWVQAWKGENARVKFVDYGNADLVERSKLYHLDDALWRATPLARPFMVRSFAVANYALTKDTYCVKFTASVCQPQKPSLGYVVEVEQMKLVTAPPEVSKLQQSAPVQAAKSPTPQKTSAISPTTREVEMPPTSRIPPPLMSLEIPNPQQSLSPKTSAIPPTMETTGIPNALVSKRIPVAVSPVISQPAVAKNGIPNSQPYLVPDPTVQPASDNIQLPPGMATETIRQMLGIFNPPAKFPTASELPDVVRLAVLYIEPSNEQYVWAIILNDESLIEFNTLMCTLQSLSPEQDVDVSGRRGCARYEQDWSRVFIEHVSGPTAVVKFVDFGNSETVELSDVKQLPADLWKFDPQAMPIKIRSTAPGCPKLSANQGYNEYTATVCRLPLLRQEFIVEVENLQGDAPALAAYEGAAAAEAVGQAQASSPNPPPPPHIQTPAQPDVPPKENHGAAAASSLARPIPSSDLALPPGMRTDLLNRMLEDCAPGSGFLRAENLASPIQFCIMHLEPDASYFWAVVTSEMEDEMVQMLNLLMTFDAEQSVAVNNDDLDDVKKGCALFEATWNRAWVQERCGLSRVNVKFVDYGNSHIIDCSTFYQLPEKFWKCRPLVSPFHARSFAPGLKSGLNATHLNLNFTANVCRTQGLGQVIELENVALESDSANSAPVEIPAAQEMPNKTAVAPEIPAPNISSPAANQMAAQSPRAMEIPAVPVPAGMRAGLLDRMVVECFPGPGLIRVDELPAEIQLLVWYVEPSDRNFFWALVSTEQSEAAVRSLASVMLELPPSSTPVSAASKKASALYEGMKNRVWIESVNGPQCVIKFVDFGNTEQAELSSLTALPENVWTQRPMATPFYAASFQQPELQGGALVELMRIVATVRRPQQLHLGHVIELTNIRLYTADESVATAAVAQPTAPAEPAVSAAPESSGSRQQIQIPAGMDPDLLDRMMAECQPGPGFLRGCDLPEGRVEFVPLYVEDGSHCWAMLVTEQAKSDVGSLMRSLSQLPQQMPAITPEQRRACVYQDQEWTRVWIQSMEGSSATVKFVDYGNAACVPVSSLCNLFDVFWDKRPFVAPLRLRSISPQCPALAAGLSELHVNKRMTAMVSQQQNPALHHIIELEDVLMLDGQ